jgi:phosphatidylglycerophosphatase A
MLSTLFGVGYLPLLGGTCASLLGVFIFLVFKSNFVFFIFTLVVVVLSFPLTSWGEKFFKEKDCQKIVIDDLCGMLLSLVFIPKEVGFIISAFIIFRFFDFFKVYPANKIEHLKGGWGIVGDDLIAGLYTNVVLQGAKFALKISS